MFQTLVLVYQQRDDVCFERNFLISRTIAIKRVELCTSATVFKYWKGIAPSYLNEMFMPSLDNYNTRSQMALDIPLCRTTKRQKIMQFLGPKIWNKVSLNIKTDATTSSFTHRLKEPFWMFFRSSLPSSI